MNKTKRDKIALILIMIPFGVGLLYAFLGLASIVVDGFITNNPTEIAAGSFALLMALSGTAGCLLYATSK